MKKKMGRPKFSLDKIPIKFYQYLSLYEEGKINKSELAELAGISYPSVYRYLRKVGCKK